jgi:hypothetical protein
VNFVIVNRHWDPSLEEPLFGEPVQRLEATVDIYDVLVAAGVFSSRSQARKNWKQTGPEVPEGFSMWCVGKTRKLVTLWLPMPHSESDGDTHT